MVTQLAETLEDTGSIPVRSTSLKVINLDSGVSKYAIVLTTLGQSRKETLEVKILSSEIFLG